MRESDKRRGQPDVAPDPGKDPNTKEYWARYWAGFDGLLPTSRRNQILGFMLVPLIVFGGIAIALIFPDAR
jgi:hypothetical protein